MNADLVAGRVDIVLADAVAMDYFLKTDEGKDFEKKGFAPNDPLYGAGVGAGVRKEDATLKEKLNAAIKTVRTNGTHKQINDKYFNFDAYGHDACELNTSAISDRRCGRRWLRRQPEPRRPVDRRPWAAAWRSRPT